MEIQSLRYYLKVAQDRRLVMVEGHEVRSISQIELVSNAMNYDQASRNMLVVLSSWVDQMESRQVTCQNSFF